MRYDGDLGKSSGLSSFININYAPLDNCLLSIAHPGWHLVPDLPVCFNFKLTGDQSVTYLLRCRDVENIRWPVWEANFSADLDGG